jgi:hypothetical protein
MAYITVSGLKSYMGITESTEDALLGIIITMATDAVDDYTGRTFEPTGTQGGHHTHYYTPLLQRYGGDLDNSDGRTLWLNQDLAELQSVVNGDGVTIPSGEYVTLPYNLTPWYAIRLKRGSNYSWTYSGISPERTILITGKWCYSLEAPGSIQLAMYKLCSYLYRGRADGQSDRDVLSTDGVVLAAARIPTDVQSLLRPYRRLM